MGTKRRIGAQWTHYLERVVPAGAEEVQVEGTRLAFYAGASALFAIMMDMLEPGVEETPGDLRNMDELHQELQEHVAELKRARG